MSASIFQEGNRRDWATAAVGRPVVRLLRQADLTAEDRACWAALSAQAGAANIFAQDWFMEAALSHSHDGCNVLLAVVGPERGPWLGVMPLIAESRFGRWPVPNWRTWSATNQFLGTPLVAAQFAGIFWDVLLPFLDAHAGGEVLLHVKAFDADDPVSTALVSHCQQQGRAFHTINRLNRPAHRAGQDATGQGCAKTLGRLRSLRRRLEHDHGSTEVALLEPDQPCAPWIDAFLRMEAAGWKGRVSSALGSHVATEALFRTVIRRGHANGSARLASLSVDGRTIAMSSWFESASWGHGFKMSFDEEFRAYAPGMLLMRDVCERIGRRPDISFDTCATREASDYRRLWRSNRTIMDGAVAIGSRQQRLYFGALMTARAAFAAIKSHFSKA